MAKKEETGCGCGSLFIGLVVLGFIIGHWQILLTITGTVALIVGIIYWPKYQAKKQQAAEEAELAKRRRALELEQQRLELEQQERELQKQREQLHPEEQTEPEKSPADDEDWADF